MTDNDNILSEPQMYQTYEVARAVNVVNAKVDALMRQFVQHEAREGGQAADGAEALVTLVDNLAAERDALRAKADKHEKEMIDYIEAAAMYQRRTADLRAERDAAQAEVEEHRRHVATLKRAVREARGHLDYGHIWTPNDTQYVRDAIAALSAALGEEAADAH